MQFSMHPLPTSPPSRARRHNTPVARSAACTHTKMTRQFNQNLLCNHCGKPGNQGWVYRCTQDFDGRIPIYESGLAEEQEDQLFDLAEANGCFLPGMAPSEGERYFHEETDLPQISLLKPWMQSAIRSGEYTNDQIKTLISQRLEVRKTIKADEARVARITREHHLALQAELKRLRYGDGRPGQANQGLTIDGQAEHSAEVFTPDELDESALATQLEMQRSASLCNYRCCPTCRPVLRERAWGSLNSILAQKDQHQLFQDVDLHTRRVSSVDVLLGIDFDRQSTQYEYSSVSGGSGTPRESDDDSYGAPVQSSSGNIPRDAPRSDTSSIRTWAAGNFEELQNVRTESLNVPRPQSRLDQSCLIDARQPSDIEPSRTVLYRSIAQALNLPVSNTTNSNTAEQAGTESSGEVHVPDGVAVTEEAVDSGLADIITQV